VLQYPLFSPVTAAATPSPCTVREHARAPPTTVGFQSMNNSFAFNRASLSVQTQHLEFFSSPLKQWQRVLLIHHFLLLQQLSPAIAATTVFLHSIIRT
jgi:hypothetical protein